MDKGIKSPDRRKRHFFRHPLNYVQQKHLAYKARPKKGTAPHTHTQTRSYTQKIAGLLKNATRIEKPKMPSFKRNNRLDHSSTTNLSMPMATDKCSIPTICINVSETNNNTIDSLSSPPVRPNLLQCLPEILTDIELNGEKTKMNHNLSEAFVKGDLYKPYIFGKLSIFRQKTGRILRGVFFI